MNEKKYLNYSYLIAVFYISYVVLLNSNLPVVSLGFYEPRPSFWDLNNGMKHLWECYGKVGFNLFSFDYSTFPNLDQCHNFNYGYFSLISFGFTNLLTHSVIFWGYLQVFIFTFLTTKVYFLSTIKIIKPIFLLAAFSPGIFLLFITGNMDIQIACLLLIATLLFYKKEKTSLFLIFITALFKFYTAPVLLLALLLVKQKISRIFGIGLILIMIFAISYQMITNPLPPFPNGAQNKFGSGIFDNYLRKLGIPVSEFSGEILGITLLLICFLSIVYFHKKFSQTKDIPVNISKKQEILCINYLIMATTSISCYLAALNVDYRLTFIVLAGIALLQIPHVQVKYISKMFPYVWLLSLWIVFPFASLKKYIGLDLQPVGDLLMIATISYFIFQGFFIYKLVKYKDLIL